LLFTVFGQKRSSLIVNMKKEKLESRNRRAFIKKSTLAFGVFTIVPRFVLGRGYIAPSDKINLGVIGLGKQGSGLAKRFIAETEAQVVAGCDVFASKRDVFQEQITTQYAKLRGVGKYEGLKTYLDYKEMLERPDIDGVIVATPDHWHAIQSIDSMNAGKDLYCEKPLTRTICEGRAMVDSAKKNARIVQVGSMQRSWDRFQIAVDIVKSGKLGKISKILVNVGDPAIPYDLKGESLPEGVDWNGWCGPAPILAYNHRIAPTENKFFPDWRFYKETAGGILADWGAHMFDIVQWALDMDDSGPLTYMPPKDPKAVRGLRMMYANGVEMVHEDFGRKWGVRFIGTEGRMDISRNYLDTSNESILKDYPTGTEKPYTVRGNHYQDWLTAMKSRGETISTLEAGHRTASICNIANIAYWTGKDLTWDPAKEKFKGNRKANKLRKGKDRKY
jgi:predicted dehydrogenase